MTKILLREPYLSRHQRWESRRIDQMGFVNNLLIGLSSVLLFWLCQGALEGKIHLSLSSFWAVFASGVSLFISLSSGLWLAINRLSDFRKTTELIRWENNRAYYKKQNRTGEVEELDSRIGQRKKETNRLGKISRRLLKAQAILFGCGLFLFSVGAILTSLSTQA